jgi:hypothetical protein
MLVTVGPVGDSQETEMFELLEMMTDSSGHIAISTAFNRNVPIVKMIVMVISMVANSREEVIVQ